MNKRGTFRSVLIFGGAGFIGSNLAEWLLQNSEAKIHIFDNLVRPGVRYNLATLERLAGRSRRLQITVADIRDAEIVERAVRHATEIYHFAAQVAVTTSVAEPRFDFDVNLQGTLNILEAVRKATNRPFLLFTSTNKVYGNASSGEVWPESSVMVAQIPKGLRNRNRWISVRPTGAPKVQPTNMCRITLGPITRIPWCCGCRASPDLVNLATKIRAGSLIFSIPR